MECVFVQPYEYLLYMTIRKWFGLRLALWNWLILAHGKQRQNRVFSLHRSQNQCLVSSHQTLNITGTTIKDGLLKFLQCLLWKGVEEVRPSLVFIWYSKSIRIPAKMASRVFSSLFYRIVICITIFLRGNLVPDFSQGLFIPVRLAHQSISIIFLCES